jgi:peptidoglycan/LPS O-acetylase OafA/YrhL
MVIKYLPGLNGLRFLLAALVIFRHGWQSVDKLGLVPSRPMPLIFVRGVSAVDFFFTLSGFLITYLLLQEQAVTGAISLKNFYLRRVCRIWPPYFLVVLIGFLFFGLIYPHLFGAPYFTFGIGRGILLYVFFLSNLAASCYQTGLMHPLWSIGVEEQFYLVWAPVVKWARERVLSAIIWFIVLTTAFQIVVQARLFPMSDSTAEFLGTLRYHYMAVGSLTAWVLFYRGAEYCRSFAAARGFQAMIFALLLCYYFLGFPIRDSGALDAFVAILYSAAILSLSVAPRRLVNLEREPLIYLGKISYGLYVYHMLADYALRFAFQKLHVTGEPNALLATAYCLALLPLTILIGHLSYRYMETRFLALARTARA